MRSPSWIRAARVWAGLRVDKVSEGRRPGKEEENSPFPAFQPQAVGWSKKPELVMRSPSWIRAARSGPG